MLWSLLGSLICLLAGGGTVAVIHLLVREHGLKVTSRMDRPEKDDP